MLSHFAQPTIHQRAARLLIEPVSHSTQFLQSLVGFYNLNFNLEIVVVMMSVKLWKAPQCAWRIVL
jgi:hypothetical protein